MIKPLPCPFCGDEVELIYKMGDLDYTPNTVEIRCESCGIGFVEVAEEWKQGPGTSSIKEHATWKVTKKWNTRWNTRSKGGES